MNIVNFAIRINRLRLFMWLLICVGKKSAFSLIYVSEGEDFRHHHISGVVMDSLNKKSN